MWKFFIKLFIAISMIWGCSNDKTPEKKPLNAIKKSHFDGEWFANATVVAKHFHSSLAFTGLQCPVERVRFEITKDKLLAYRSYDKGSNNDDSRNQALVAAFTITEHDDGNSSNRPWNEREFIKVDWSKNLAPHIECNGWLKAITALSIDNSDAADPSDAFRVRMLDDYMESTVDALVEPDTKTCEAIGESCYPAEYRVKFSFRKVSPSNDYQKMNYPDDEPIRMGKNDKGFCIDGEEKDCQDVTEVWLYDDGHTQEICDPLRHNISDCFLPSIKMNSQFGYFRSYTQGYSRQEGFTRRGAEELINRRNIWQRSVDDNGQIIPLKYRHPKKIIYYLNPGFPADLMPLIKSVEEEWNGVFAHAIASAKGSCTVAKAQEFANRHQLMKQVHDAGISSISKENLQKTCSLLFDLSKNNVEQEVFFTGDAREVTEVFDNVFEIRPNQCNQTNVEAYVKRNHLGDILTKYNLSTISDDTIERACAVLEWAGQHLGLSENFSWQQVGDLRYSFINVHLKPETAHLLGYGPIAVDPKTGEIISATANIYLANIIDASRKSVVLAEKKDNAPLKDKRSFDSGIDDADELSLYVNKAVGTMSEATYRSERNASYQINNLAKLADLPIFSSFAGWSLPIKAIGAQAMSEADDIIALLFAKSKVDKQQEKMEFFSKHSACFAHAENQIPDLKPSKDPQNENFTERLNKVKEKVFLTTIRHELGHNFGLRHNFKGAYDAMNYPPAFWEGSAKGHPDGLGFLKDELRSSSVMDYHKNLQDSQSLGLYDYAAIMAGYVGKIYVFDTSDEDFIPRSFIQQLDYMSYKDLPFLFSGSNADSLVRRHFQKVRDLYLQGDLSAHMQISTLGLESKAENLYKRRIVDFSEYKQKTIEGMIKGDPSLTAVPFAFCTDGQVGMDIACQPFVFGSSVSEIVDRAIADHELMSSLTGPDAKLMPTDVPSYLSFTYKRVYEPIIRAYQSMYRNASSSNVIFPAIHDLAVASKLGLAFISRVLETVEPGEYCQDDNGDYVPKAQVGVCRESLVIDEQQGKKYHSAFGEELLGPPQSIGFVYDKILALLALIDDQATLDHEFDAWRRGEYSIGFYRVFTPQIVSLFTNIYTQDWIKLAPTIVKDEDGTIRINYRNLFLDNKFGEVVDQPRIKPSYSSILRDYAILFSMAGLSNPFDHKLDFSRRAQINLTRSNDGRANNVDGIVFTDPNTSLSYYASAHLGEEPSLGYLLLKDAQAFIEPGGDSESPLQGPWYQAKNKMDETVLRFNQLRFSLSGNDYFSIEKEVIDAQQAFLAQDRMLLEKVHVIEQICSLSKKFAE